MTQRLTLQCDLDVSYKEYVAHFGVSYKEYVAHFGVGYKEVMPWMVNTVNQHVTGVAVTSI